MLATAAKGILSSRHLIYVDEDIKSTNAITPNHSLSKQDKDFKDFKDKDFTSAETLIEIWRKGPSHLDRLWKILYGHYLFSLRETYKLRIEEPKDKSQAENLTLDKYWKLKKT